MIRKAISLVLGALIIGLLVWGCSSGKQKRSGLLPDGGWLDGATGYAGFSGQGSGGSGAAGKGGAAGKSGAGGAGAGGSGAGAGGTGTGGSGASGSGGAGGGTGGGPNCGNNVVDSPDEQCDGDDLNNATCLLLEGVDGVLSCTSECTYDVSMCGNGGTGGSYGG